MVGVADQGLDHVFGYGSLVADLPDAQPAVLAGYRRVFGVATDNSRVIAGYKRYLRGGDGTAPDVFVAFVDLEQAPGCEVNGLLAPVTGAGLAVFDARERNYERIDVSAAVRGGKGRIWTYVGSEAGRARLARGVSEGRAVVSRDYMEKVHAGFRRLGEEQYAAFLASSRFEALPVWDLERIEIP